VADFKTVKRSSMTFLFEVTYAVDQRGAMSKRKLKVVAAPTKPVELAAPPILDAYGSLEFSCGDCDTPMLIADEGQILGVLIRCSACGAVNTTDS
jgi:hypothetical protein